MFATTVIADSGEIEVYRPNEVFDLSIHLTNTTGVVLGAICQVEIRNSSYGVIEELTLNEINGGWYNATYNTSKVGKFFCRQNCTKDTLFVATTCDFVVEGDENIPIAIILTVIFVIGVYFFILVRLITSMEFTEHGLVKLLFYLTAFWVVLLPLNMAVQFNTFNGGPTVVTDNLNLLYTIIVWINYFITIYFMLWFIIQILKKVGRSNNRIMFEDDNT